MENNEVFEAEAALEARSRSYGSRRRGNGVVKATNGGIGSRKESDYDETPLLSREIDHDYGSSIEASNDGDTRGPPEWSGERDFEGRPWWSKPSVSQDSLMSVQFVNRIVRSTGYYHLSSYIPSRSEGLSCPD